MKSWVFVGVVVLVVVVLFVGFEEGLFLSKCESLKEKFDDVESKGLIPARYGEAYKQILIGGELIKIEYLGPNRSMASDLDAYNLYFRGREKEAFLYLMTTFGNVLPYEKGSFYFFDQGQISASGAHSGEFIDREMNKLEILDC
ncbi:MAG: hypothetical protein KKB31_07080 [Nanoarchaeota archaeon]|nr:hypothetical protein [Nanoarchaeota archaeon]